MTQRLGLWGAAVSLPLVGLWILLAQPRLDVVWEDHRAHFWLVFTVALANFGLGLLMNEGARRRRDARLFLVSLAFLASAGFFALHALATPGVLLDGQNSGFVFATPVGLLIAAGLLLASSLRVGPETAARIMGAERLARSLLLGLLLVWLGVSLGNVPPLDRAPPEAASAPLIAFALAGVLLYGTAAANYFALYSARRAPLLLAIVTACALLAEAMIAAAFGRNWHATWWEWHLLMLVAFGIVLVQANREWRGTGSTADVFSDVFLEETRAELREVSVIFADLEGYTSFSERSDPETVAAMLDEYVARTSAAAERHGGRVGKQIGDAIMVTFNAEQEQPDHALLAARAGLELQRTAAAITAQHPEWPRLRVGVNTGPARRGYVGGREEYTVVGDTINLAARLEGTAPPGEVVVGAETYERLPPGTIVETLGAVRIKGKENAVEAYVLRDLPPGRPGD